MPNSPLGFMDSLDNIARALIDSSRRVLVSVDAVSLAGGVPVVSTNADKLVGYFGNVAQVTAGVAVTGNTTITGANVPAGQLWMLDSISAFDSSRKPTGVSIYIWSGTQFWVYYTSAATDFFVPVVGQWALGPGDHVECIINGTVVGDNIGLRLHGYYSHTT